MSSASVKTLVTFAMIIFNRRIPTMKAKDIDNHVCAPVKLFRKTQSPLRNITADSKYELPIEHVQAPSSQRVLLLVSRGQLPFKGPRAVKEWEKATTMIEVTIRKGTKLPAIYECA